MLYFAFNQGYICGIFGKRCLGYKFENVDKTKPLEWEEIVIESVKKSVYYDKLSKLLSEEELIDFDEGLKLGAFNGIAIMFNQMNMYYWDSRQSQKIIHEDKPYYGVYGISRIGKDLVCRGKEIGKVRFFQAWGIADYRTIVPVEGGCDRCGYSKFCNCYSFSSMNYKMAGCHGHHFGHDICIICGENNKSKKNFMCDECFDPSLKSEEEYRKERPFTTDFRPYISKTQDHKRTFFKDRGMKCLNCEKEVDPTNGLVSCSTECNVELLKEV